MQRVAIRVALFALLGLLIEVFFTAAFQLKDGNWNMHGKTSPWMMLDYGLLGILIMPIAQLLIRKGVPLFIRAAVYMVGIFIIEYFSGLLFVACGLRLWDYSHYAYNLHGQITLLYAPAWYFLGLWVETLYRYIDAMAVTLRHGFRADELESLAQDRNKENEPQPE